MSQCFMESQKGLLRMARKYERAEWFEKAVAQRLLLESTETGRRAGLVRGSSAGVKCLRRQAQVSGTAQ